MDYLSFDLRLGEWDADSRTGVAEVLQSPAGEGQPRSFLLGVNVDECARRVYRSATMAAELGRELANAVLSDECLMLWHESYQIARERRRGLRLRLHIEPWELARLPWELLYDARRGEFLVFDPRVSLVRYIRLHWAPPTFRQSKSLQVLVVVASPGDQAQLDAPRELAVLRNALRELESSGRVQVIISEHTTHEDLHIRLLENAPDVVHFIGHGEYDHARGQGFLLLEDEKGQTDLLGATEAARMLRRYGTNLVVLNAGNTATGAWAGLAPALMRAEIPAVVAMQWPVEDRAAIRFSRSFYTALSLGKSIDECMAEGRLGASASSRDPNDWAAPVLFLRSLSGQLWTNELVGAPGDHAAPTLRSPSSGEGAWEAPAERAEGDLFKTRGPLLSATDSALIIDRPELKRALRIAQQPSVTQYVALLGARQMGKTTQLFRIMDLLRHSYACVFVDLSVLRAQDARACFRFVALRLLGELRSLWGESLTLPEMHQIESAVEFLRLLREVAAAAPVPRIILLIDEVGALSPEVSDSFFNTLRTVFTQGRGASGPLAKYLCIFSGAVDLYALTSGSNSPLNICEKLYLSDLELVDVRHIVGQFARLGVAVGEEVAERVYAWAHGHPYLTMRLCALMEQAGLEEIKPADVDRAAEQMLVEDDNIRHVIHELERRPAEQRRLHRILIEGQQVPFSRHDPVLASLEMIGVLRATQPCVVRNRLYEDALRQYYAHCLEETPDLKPLTPLERGANVGRIYARLATLRAEALGADQSYRRDQAWETFAAALFSLVPAFSVYPDLHAHDETLDLVLGIDAEAPGGDYWKPYGPAILVACGDLRQGRMEALLTAVRERAARYGLKLAFVMLSGERPELADALAACSGTREGVTVVLLRDAEIARLLEQRADLGALLRTKVLDARLRRL